MDDISPEFVLGKHIFRLVSKKKSLLKSFRKLLPGNKLNPNSSESIEDEHLIDLDKVLDEGAKDISRGEFDEQTLALNAIIGQALSKHEGCLWVDAATLVAPNGKVFLLAGPSFAGKTTLTLAMFMAYKWQALSEDVTLLDMESKQIIPVARPSFLRPGTAKMLKEITGIDLALMAPKGWLFKPNMFVQSLFPAKLAYAIHLELSKNDHRAQESAAEFKMEKKDDQSMLLSNELLPTEISESIFLRQLLPLSNALRFSRGINFLNEMLNGVRCFNFTGGTLRQRMDVLLQIANKD